MQRFKNILFIAHGDDPDVFHHAAAQALELARDNQATLTIADVIEPLSQVTTMLLKHAMPMERVKAFREAERRAWLNNFITQQLNEEPGVTIKCQVITGAPYVEIIRLVLREQYDLVIKTAQNDNIVEQLFGSTDLHLMRKCPCPVWLMKQQQAKEYSRVLAAIDLGQQESAGIELNNTIIGLATSFARLNDSELHILQCWDLPSDNVLKRALTQFGAEDKNRILQLTEKNYHHWVNDLLLPYKINKSKLHLHLKQGDPRQVIPYIAQKFAADLIIMGTVAQTGIEGFIIGSTAEEVLKQIKTSVLAIKPAGFKTPIQLLPAPGNKPEDIAA